MANGDRNKEFYLGVLIVIISITVLSISVGNNIMGAFSEVTISQPIVQVETNQDPVVPIEKVGIEQTLTEKLLSQNELYLSSPIKDQPSIEEQMILTALERKEFLKQLIEDEDLKAKLMTILADVREIGKLTVNFEQEMFSKDKKRDFQGATGVGRALCRAVEIYAIEWIELFVKWMETTN